MPSVVWGMHRIYKAEVSTLPNADVLSHSRLISQRRRVPVEPGCNLASRSRNTQEMLLWVVQVLSCVAHMPASSAAWVVHRVYKAKVSTLLSVDYRLTHI